jgi:hypothetical protein
MDNHRLPPNHPHRYPIALSACATALSFVILGCASVPPPTELMAVSSASLADANAAGANEAAPIEMRAARDKLDRAKAAMSDKNNELARSLAQEARVDAQLAEAKAHAAKASKAAEAVHEDSRVLQEELKRKAN